MTQSTSAGPRSSSWGVLLRLAALAAVLGAASAITFGYLGWLHPAFDSFSHFRIHLAAALLMLVIPLLLLRFVPEACFAAVLGATAIIQTAGIPMGAGALPAQAIGGDTSAVYRLLQINLRYDNPEPARILSLIGELKPDVITLNEVSPVWRDQLALLEAAYPYRILCPPPANVGGSAIVSRRPFAAGIEPSCADRGSVATATIDIGGNIVDVAAIHMGWPWPFEQPWQLPHIEPSLSELGDTAIVAGDLNAVPWSQTARRISQASGTRILRGIGPTWLDYMLPNALRPLVGLPIDNVMVKGGIVPHGVRALDEAGSDHLPVLLEFSVLPQEQPAPVQHAALSK